MLASSVVVAAALLGGAAAQGQAAAAVDVNQLETARLTQAAQRVEFGVEGEKSAFKFSFSDPVRIPLRRRPHPRMYGAAVYVAAAMVVAN